MMTMRFLVPLLITWAFLGISHAERADIRVFKVSKTGGNKDLLLRLFEGIRSQEASKNSGRLARFMKELHVRQRVSSTTYLVDGELPGEPYWFVAKKPLNKVDGDWIVCLVKTTDEVKSYTTVLKAKKTVRVIKEVDESDLNLPPLLTKEKFTEELKAGKTWTVTLVDICQTCGGSGKLKSVGGTRACNNCAKSRFSSSGSGQKSVTYSVQW